MRRGGPNNPFRSGDGNGPLYGSDVVPPPFKDWFWKGLGAILLATLLWGANNVYQLNLTAERVLATIAAQTQVLQDHSERIRALEVERRREHL